jgi:hypothetical protein
VVLEKAIDIKQVNTYSWHPNTRGPQVYKLYASDGSGEGFNASPKKGTDPEKAGWKLIASVDTRPKEGDMGGQYGVSISDSQGALGKFKYLLFDCSRTESDDDFGNTFYSEIDVIEQNAGAAAADGGAPVADASAPSVFKTPDGKYEFTIDSSQAPDMKEWADTKLAPVMVDWYPKIVELLPSEGYSAPAKFTLQIQNPGNGVAATGGTHIMCNASWMRRNERGEAIGAIVHEMVHVVQQYGRARRTNPNASRNPGWLVEGAADYVRWYKYEPQSHGTEIRDASRAQYDSSYRITANFLNWVSEKYDKQLVPKLNAAMRQGEYSDDLWKKLTGKTADDLGGEWKQAIADKLAGKPQAPIMIDKPADKTDAGNADPGAADANTLTDAEKKEGWKLLFDGKSLDGWHSFHRDNVRPGWKVQDGTLACVDPHNAGDLCTNDKYDWFELQLDYNITHAGNSGIMYHVTDKGGAVWATGPEFQLEDNTAASDPIRCGWLYALYQPPIDPATGKTLDATKPVGEWNHVRLLMTPEKCVHEINGVKYFEYVLNSDDFKQRVAKSKFASMPDFAKSDIGYIALQGDHGAISFRNIKVKPIESKPKE